MQSTRGSRDLRPELSGIDSSDGDSDNSARSNVSPEQQLLNTGQTFYLNHSLLEQSNEADKDLNAFTLDQGWVQYSHKQHCFFVKYKPPDPKIEINTKRLKPHLQNRFYDPKNGSRRKEWDKLKSGGSVKVWRGAQARALRQQFADRTVTTRWHDKWKDMGEEFVSDIAKADLIENDITEHQDAKSRWIMQGFTDPDIAFLNRTVPTPASEDIMLALQLIASIQGEAGISDVSSAFGQSIQGLRGTGRRLFANAPEGGLPGEEGDVLIELLTEIYGLVSGPPGWRRTLLSKFKDLEFSRHPLAPCVMLMYETFEPSSVTRKALRDDKENNPPMNS
jgi:hypothetical protein